MNRESLKVGLKMNTKKTKVMRICRVHFEHVHIQDESLVVVDEHIYLGQLTQTNTSNEKEIKRRIRLGWSAFANTVAH